MTPPSGVSQQGGDWVFDEFQGSAAKPAIDLDLLDRLKNLMGTR
jgi:hypothetical protein